jgi:4-amino-4-deoxy-L-arabinose transferase-like glycosyltransferase
VLITTLPSIPPSSFLIIIICARRRRRRRRRRRGRRRVGLWVVGGLVVRSLGVHVLRRWLLLILVVLLLLSVCVRSLGGIGGGRDVCGGGGVMLLRLEVGLVVVFGRHGAD